MAKPVIAESEKAETTAQPYRLLLHKEPKAIISNNRAMAAKLIHKPRSGRSSKLGETAPPAAARVLIIVSRPSAWLPASAEASMDFQTMGRIMPAKMMCGTIIMPTSPKLSGICAVVP